MRVYLNASLLGKVKHPAEYKKIISIAQELGHEIFADHVMKRHFVEVNQQSREEHERDFQRTRSEIQASDVMIIEGTYPSIGVGRLTGIALDMHKPVLILYRTTPHGLLVGDPNRLLTITRYDLKKEAKLKKIIESFFRRAQHKAVQYKFNLIMNEVQNQYLDWAARKNSVSKAEILRSLIDRQISSDPTYKKNIKL